MVSSEAAQAAGQSAGELRDLREQLLAVATTESELRLELKAARAQIAQLAQNEAMARSLLKESHSVTRALHERTRLETDAATAELRESLEAERAKSQAELARAAGLLRTQGNRPDAEMETLRALFTDLMRGEALGRQRLERLQQQVAEHEQKRQELEQQLDLERDAGRAQAERDAAEVEWARERVKAAAESAQEAKDAVLEVRRQFTQAQEKLREDADERERAGAQFADQFAGLRKKSEDERARANAEIARRVQAVGTLQEAVTAASAAANKVAADLEEEKAVAARLRAEVGQLESARDVAQDAARDLSVRERRTDVELAETQARATRLESKLDELRPALAARTEAESAARAATAQAERERDEVQRALAGLEEELRCASDQARAQQVDQVRKVEDERAQLVAAKAEQARLSAEAERLRASEEERGRTAEALAGELGLARGDAETLQGALDRNGAALASLQARHARLEADLVKALHERDEEAGSRVEQAALLRDERTQAAGHLADLEAALAQKDSALVAELRARAEEVGAMRAQRDAEQKRLAGELLVETTRAENALRESQGLVARCDTSERELAEAAQRMRAAETDAAQAKAAQERLSTIASVRREALIAELDGRFADAEALLQAELGQSPIEAPMLLQLGRLHYAWAEGSPGSHEEIAERLLARAAELDLYDATAPLYLGHVRLRRGLHRAAREAYRETIDRDAQCAPAHEALAVLSVRSMKRQAQIAFAAAIALLLCSAALLVHRLVQGTAAPAASAFSESQERPAKSEVVPGRRSAER